VISLTAQKLTLTYSDVFQITYLPMQAFLHITFTFPAHYRKTDETGFMKTTINLKLTSSYHLLKLAELQSHRRGFSYKSISSDSLLISPKLSLVRVVSLLSDKSRYFSLAQPAHMWNIFSNKNSPRIDLATRDNWK